VASIERRLAALEGLIQPPEQEDEAAARRRALIRDTLNEFASLKASGAAHSRGGKRIEPEDIPAKILGPGYTKEELWELAERRVRERRT
jgi:hypothetical protein